MKDHKIIMGRLASPYGIHGWIKVVSFTDPPENLLQYTTWQIQIHDNWQNQIIEKSRTHGKFLLVKFIDCDNPETARQFTNALVAIDRDELPTLESSQYYWADLIGLRVVNLTGVELGHLDSLIETGANDVMIVKNHRERWIPYIKTVVKSIDLKQKTITVDWDPEF